MEMETNRPIAVLISDIHFTVPTLDLASKALRQARNTAYELRIPLILCGDTLDSKAIIRGECANALIAILGSPYDRPPETYVLVGNHDLLNEKSTEHSITFLKPHCTVIDTPVWVETLKTYFIPYMSNRSELEELLRTINSDSRIIMHQGVLGAHMGHYIQDKTSLPAEAFENFRVISGHYHRKQDIKCGRPRKGAVGLFSYVGNPYSLSFSEANDGPKGIQILHSDGLLEFVPTNLRQHRIVEVDCECLINSYTTPAYLRSHDMLWVKVTGSSIDLKKLNKQEIGKKLLGHSNFKLDLIPTDSVTLNEPLVQLSEDMILDKLIDSTDDSPENCAALKALWRELL